MGLFFRGFAKVPTPLTLPAQSPPEPTTPRTI
jgi:hypothetical protein